MADIQLERFLPYRLARIATAISLDLRRTYNQRHRLTVPEWRTLATIAQLGETTAGRIGAHAMLHKTKVSRAVAALEARRWVQRRRNPEDRRGEFLDLTAVGRRAFDEMAPDMLRYQSALLARLNYSPEALEELLDVLETALDLGDTSAEGLSA